MLLAHRIRIDPTLEQRDYFARAAGTARRVWNWALAEWQRQAAAGGKPNAMALKKQFNRIKYSDPAWLRPLKAALRRLRIRSRRLSRKLEAAKALAGIAGRIPKGTRLPVSKNRIQGAQALVCLHARIARVRQDFTHKLTTRLCRENQAVAIEDLNVGGMLANARLARAISDVGFHEIRRQLLYKAARYGTLIVLADRWYPSSKLCSGCGARNAALALGERTWACAGCGAYHDRDINAAINLQRLATGALAAATALPVASPAATPGTAAGQVPAGGGKVTPARHEHGQRDGSGQEENAARFCARFC